jgi:hypothetical protein
VIDVEAKKAEAKALRGVSYDARIDRFTSEIYVGGVRRWLGSYITAREAHEAYLEADADREVVKRVSAFSQAYTAFRDRHGGREKMPPEGSVLEYDGQKFKYTGLTWRKSNGRPFAYATWSSACKTCGAEYKTMSPAAVTVAKGVTRNCPQHTRAPRGFAQRGKGKPSGYKPITASEQIADALEPMSLLRDSITLDEAAEIVHAAGRLLNSDGTTIGLMLQRSINNNDPHTQFISLRDGVIHFV